MENSFDECVQTIANYLNIDLTPNQYNFIKLQIADIAFCAVVDSDIAEEAEEVLKELAEEF